MIDYKQTIPKNVYDIFGIVHISEQSYSEYCSFARTIL